MFPWLRKNSFIKDLRNFLHSFKICEITREVTDEASFNDKGELARSGRQIITIKLIGYWRGKIAGMKLDGEKSNESAIKSAVDNNSEQ